MVCSMGGTMAFLASCKLNGLSAAVCYYGGQIAKNADEKPKVPTQMHFGDKDASIPMSDVEIIKKKRGGDSEIYVYPDAQHGFHCDERGSFHGASAKAAWARAMDFLKKHLKKCAPRAPAGFPCSRPAPTGRPARPSPGRANGFKPAPTASPYGRRRSGSSRRCRRGRNSPSGSSPDIAGGSPRQNRIEARRGFRW